MEEAGSGGRAPFLALLMSCAFMLMSDTVERSRATRRGSRRPALPLWQQPDEREKDKINTRLITTGWMHTAVGLPGSSISAMHRDREPLSKTWAVLGANRSPRSISLTFTLSNAREAIKYYCQKINFFKNLQINSFINHS